MDFSDIEPLVNEVEALRAEVLALRMAVQTLLHHSPGDIGAMHEISSQRARAGRPDQSPATERLYSEIERLLDQMFSVAKADRHADEGRR